MNNITGLEATIDDLLLANLGGLVGGRVASSARGLRKHFFEERRFLCV